MCVWIGFIHVCVSIHINMTKINVHGIFATVFSWSHEISVRQFSSRSFFHEEFCTRIFGKRKMKKKKTLPKNGHYETEKACRTCEAIGFRTSCVCLWAKKDAAGRRWMQVPPKHHLVRQYTTPSLWRGNENNWKIHINPSCHLIVVVFASWNDKKKDRPADRNIPLER